VCVLNVVPLTARDLEDIQLARELLASGEGVELREQSHLTRAEVGAAVGGYSADAVALWETGRRTPRTDAARRLGRLYRRLGASPEVTA
jgi:DNA-binding transcriptional regulator YiaG